MSCLPLARRRPSGFDTEGSPITTATTAEPSADDERCVVGGGWWVVPAGKPSTSRTSTLSAASWGSGVPNHRPAVLLRWRSWPRSARCAWWDEGTVPTALALPGRPVGLVSRCGRGFGLVAVCAAGAASESRMTDDEALLALFEASRRLHRSLQDNSRETTRDGHVP